VTNSGGAMPRKTLDALRARLPETRFYLMYGLTEAFRSTYLPPEEVDRRPDSMGKAIPNAEILVVREDGSPCAPGEPGELVHRGALVSLGYWNDPERTAERFRPAPGQPAGIPMPEMAVWSGDTVRSDEDGFLYFIGRRDEMIKTSGYRVSPNEVEEVVYGTGLVAEVAALGIPHPVLGQGIVLVVLREGAGLTREALLEALRPLLPAYMMPGHVEMRTRTPAPQRQRQDRPQEPGHGFTDLFRGERRAVTDTRPGHARWTSSPWWTTACRWAACPCARLAERVGQTPFYAYDRQVMTRRVEQLRAALPDGCRSTTRSRPTRCRRWCSTWRGWWTAWTWPPGASCGWPWIRDAGRGDQLRRPRKVVPELEMAVAAGITLNLESETELERVAAIAERTGQRPTWPCGSTRTSSSRPPGMKMSGGPKAFGVDAERVPALLGRIGELGLHFPGLSHLLRLPEPAPRGLVEAQGHTFDLACAWPNPPRPRWRCSTSAAASASPTSPATARWISGPIAEHLGRGCPRCATACPRRRSSWNWAATWWARRASTWPRSSTARNPAARCS
jgi:hypothetical protein